MPDTRALIKNDIARAVSILLISWIAIFLDPFQLLSLTDDASDRVFFNLIAADYPEKNRPKSVAVVVNDAMLKRRGIAWPLTYAAHAAIIDRIAYFSPDALFIDFVFLDERTDPISPLLAALETHANNFPIYLAVAPAADLNTPLLRRDLRALVERHPNLFLVDISSPAQSGNQGYRLYGGPVHSAALSLAQNQKTDLSVRYLPEQMAVWWPGPPLPAQDGDEAGDEDGEAIAAFGVLRGVKLLLGQLVPFRVRALNWPEPVSLGGSPIAQIDADLMGFERDRARRLIDGATVFVGSDLALLSDQVENPLYEGLPGVYLHAAAFDNLMVLGNRVFSANPPYGASLRINRFLQFLVIVTFSLVATLALRKLFGGAAGKTGGRPILEKIGAAPQLLAASGWTIFACVLIVSVTLARQAPGVWLGSAALFGFSNLGFGLKGRILKLIE